MTDTLTAAQGETRSDGIPGIPDERHRYIDGLRILASALEQHPGLELPTTGTRMPLKWNIWDDGARERIAAIARAIPCDWRKEVTEEKPGEIPAYIDLHGTLGGLKIQVTGHRDTVCERVVVGTEMRPVEKVITPAVTETVMEPAEIIEWVCEPLLAPRPAEAVPAGSGAAA